MSLEFPAVKLLDLEWGALEASANPFSIIAMAHQKAQATRRDPEGRLQWKLTLVKTLYKKGYGKDDILELFHFIDWLMVLPEDLNQRFEETIKQYEEETKMPYVSSVERRALQRGLLEKSREAVIEVLETRFEAVPQSMSEIINGLNDLSYLKALLKEAVKTPSLENFKQALEKVRT